MVPLLLFLGAARALLGIAPLIAAGPTVRLLGFPPGEATASAIVFARLFGVRDIGLGAIIAWSVTRPEVWPALVLLNLLTDVGDLSAFLAGMRGRPDLRRALGLCAAVATLAVATWALVGIWLLAST